MRGATCTREAKIVPVLFTTVSADRDETSHPNETDILQRMLGQSGLTLALTSQSFLSKLLSSLFGRKSHTLTSTLAVSSAALRGFQKKGL